MAVSASAPFQFAAFRRLAAASTVSMIGDAIAPVALAFAVLDLGGSVGDLGAVVGARSLANVLFLLLGGVVADRLPRQRLLLGSSGASALTQAAVAAVVINRVDSVALLAVLSAVNGAMSAFARPAAAALPPSTVAKPLLRQANAVLRILANVSLAAGAALAGVLVVALGAGWCIAVDAGTFVLAGAIYARLKLTEAASPARRDRMWTELLQGWGEFRSRTWLWVVVTSFAVGNAAWSGSITVLGPVVADRTFGRGYWGVVLAAETLGMIVGGLLALRLRPRYPLRSGMVLMCGLALLPLLLGVRPVFGLLVVAGVLTGLGLEQFEVAWSVTMQHQIPPDRLARAYSYDLFGSFVAIPIGQIAVGPLSSTFGLQTTLIGAAIVIVLAMSAALTSRSVRNLTNA